jgi:hypothetical protein
MEYPRFFEKCIDFVKDAHFILLTTDLEFNSHKYICHVYPLKIKNIDEFFKIKANGINYMVSNFVTRKRMVHKHFYFGLVSTLIPIYLNLCKITTNEIDKKLIIKLKSLIKYYRKCIYDRMIFNVLVLSKKLPREIALNIVKEYILHP